MVAGSLWGIAAAGFAACAGGLVGSYAVKAWDRYRMTQTVLAADSRSRMLLHLKTGVPALRPMARKLLGLAIVDGACETAVRYAQAHDIDTTKEALLSLALAAAILIAVLASVLGRSVVFGVAAASVAFVGVNIFVHNKMEKMSLGMREEIPEAMRGMETCFRSGLSLVQTLSQTARECPGNLGRLFKTAARRLEMGATPAEALSAMRGSEQVPELAFVSVALDVQHQSGGSIAPVLEAARDSVSSELDLLRSLRVQTAQAKLSAGIVTVMPFILVALFSLMSPDFLAPFFQSLIGMGLLALALIMQLSGVLIVRRMLKIDAG